MKKDWKSVIRGWFTPSKADNKMLRSLKKRSEKAEREIKKLSPELKEIAQRYLDKGYGPTVSLREALCFSEVKKQDQKIQNEVEELVKKHVFYTTSLKFAKEE